jgi:K+:H+ antiporter subunit KhtU
VILLIWAIGRYARNQLTQALARDDELPALLTFTIVILVAYFSEGIGIPDTFMAIAAGVMLGSVNAPSFERHARPFKDVFLVVFFVFFGITVQFAGEASLVAIVLICIVAVASKFVSGVAIGRVVHGKAVSGIEIWTNTIGRGEFSIAIAALYGSAIVSGVIAVMVIVTSILGAFAAQYSVTLREIWKRPDRPSPTYLPETE